MTARTICSTVFLHTLFPVVLCCQTSICIQSSCDSWTFPNSNIHWMFYAHRWCVVASTNVESLAQCRKDKVMFAGTLYSKTSFVSFVTWYSTYVHSHSPRRLDRFSPRAVLSGWVPSSDVTRRWPHQLTLSGREGSLYVKPPGWMGLDIIVWTCQSRTHFNNIFQIQSALSRGVSSCHMTLTQVRLESQIWWP